MQRPETVDIADVPKTFPDTKVKGMHTCKNVFAVFFLNILWDILDSMGRPIDKTI